MSTRSTINIEKEDKSVDSIYCHFDGYPTNVGAILLEYYTTEKKIKQLINLGDIVTLMPTVERIEPLRGRGKTKTYSNISKIPFQQYDYLWRDGNWWVARYEHGVNNKWIPLDQIIMENKSKNFYPFLNEYLSSNISG